MSDKNTTSYDAENIKVLDGLMAVRKRPSMYIGNTASEGLHHLIYEVVDNSIDEALAGYCDTISIIIHEDNAVTIEDNGRGIPVDIHPIEKISALELVMTTLHAGGKFDHATYKVSGGLHGVGVSVVNALSCRTVAEIKRNGKIYQQIYEYGERVTDLEIVGESNKTGTSITFKPDPEIFTETTDFQYEIVNNRMRELAFLNSNIHVFLKDERDGAENTYHFEGGTVSYVEYLNRKRTGIHPYPIQITGEKENVQIDICFQYFDGYSERLFSFVNNINTKEGGSHVAGFRAALTKCINRYASDDVVPKHLKEKMGGDDVREGLTCVISVRVPNPQFEGQTKTKLGNSEVKSIVESICTEKIGAYLEQNPAVARSILSKAVEAARAREAARKARDLSRTKNSLSVMMAGKLAECQSKNPVERELFIVEGDSAGGSAKQGRDRSIQAILPLRGKILNVEKARFDRILDSEEIKQLVASLGTGIGGEEFDLDKLRYHKIIIMTDADVDGAHIRTLLLTFFYRQMQPLIENGHIYIGQPPLYRLGRGKKEQYFLNDDELNAYLYSQAGQMMRVRTDDGVDIDSTELAEILYKLSDFEKVILFLERLNIPERMVLFLLANGVHSARQFEDKEFFAHLTSQLIEKNVKVGLTRSCSWRPSCQESEVIFQGQGHVATVLGPNIPLIKEYRHAFKLYKSIHPYLDDGFSITRIGTSGQETELTAENWRQLIELIRNETIKGSHLQRYKGLGEMNPEQLWDTTMNPVNRTLIRVKIDDLEQTDDLFTTLMGDKVEPRREFIQNHALEVADLDI
ncbi:DNA topoisomerase (ATP-hydrolyzing) subunit B [Desulfobulbus oligotrophicus]|uniref:DNA gyrase subunit B n=1 Tax=Desulfobulbus oligotrophicus TaxID=1909699 RepID=A0A7T6APW3_9BACT|nr:DNA topoisomerase (ATP-hydrolyzing) subunit B [Desulfobulbus oligotrophicus]MDY0390270.1 DNA topoisomerase (ATP-hydrolyzing) subunit B [Desulfobulbus oligotrophicus]QQG65093.1 DNA topoisomerase (ATP-hydrolyzing) subunit B [Desulfobulbus oligotrophicus]